MVCIMQPYSTFYTDHQGHIYNINAFKKNSVASCKCNIVTHLLLLKVLIKIIYIYSNVMFGMIYLYNFFFMVVMGVFVVEVILCVALIAVFMVVMAVMMVALLIVKLS